MQHGDWRSGMKHGIVRFIALMLFTLLVTVDYGMRTFHTAAYADKQTAPTATPEPLQNIVIEAEPTQEPEHFPRPQLVI